MYKRYHIAPNFRGIFFANFVINLSFTSFLVKIKFLGARPFHESVTCIDQVLIKIWLCWLTSRIQPFRGSVA